jgi:4'-phosphopantetheinyl transferase
LIAVAKSEIGIDVEYIKPGFDYDGIIRSNFNGQEIAYIKAENNLARFFKLWTRKEAILKATGTGITEHLKAITALDGPQQIEGDLLNSKISWNISSFDLGENYPATIAANTAVEKYRFYNLNF